MHKITYYVIKDKRHRERPFLFQDNSGNQKEAKYLFPEQALRMLDIMNRDEEKYVLEIERIG